MKRFSLILLLMALLAAAVPALAQDSANLITLNNATPAIDAVITLPADSTGTISLNLAMAAVTLTDANDAVVFYAADARLHGLDLNIAPNSGTHTLTVERLPGAAEAYVSVLSLPEMSVNGTTSLVEGSALTLNQEASLALDGGSPGGTVTVTIPAETTGVVTATFPGAGATTQLLDAQGQVIAESAGGHVDALTFVLDSGDYDFTVLGNGLTAPVVAGVRAVSTADAGIKVLEAPVTAPVDVAAADATTPNTAAACTATILVSSANLRSGPGTGYSVLGYAYRGGTFLVGGQNPENNWFVVQSGDGNTGWISSDLTQLQGSCDALTVFNIPLRDAAPVQLAITTPNNNGSYESYGDDDRYEHDDDDRYEHEDDDRYEHDDDD